MNHNEIKRERDRILRRLRLPQWILRGSLLQRTIRHRQRCPKCAGGGGHPVAVLAVGYPGGRIRQISLRRERVPRVQQALKNYYKLKAALEQVCELNLKLLRPERSLSSPRRRSRG